MILDNDFRFRDDIKADTTPVEIMVEPYKGVVLRYLWLNIKEEKNDTAILQFDYELFEMGNHTETSLRKDKRFQEQAGIILNALILESLSYKKESSE